MHTEITRRASPEEEELAKKREELALLQAELADRELFLTDLRAELSQFEALYLRQVGTLYAELDEWNAKIAELIAEQEGTEVARSAAAQARTQAEESKSAVQEAAAKEGFKASPELKKLFKEVARRIHPDYATDEADRHKREQLMKEANAAYGRGDAAALRRILEEYESSPESVKGVGVAAELVRAIRQIRQVRSRLSQIELEITSLVDSDIAKLRAKVEASRAEGRELLNEMAEDARKRIDAARRRFEASVTKAKA